MTDPPGQTPKLKDFEQIVNSSIWVLAFLLLRGFHNITISPTSQGCGEDSLKQGHKCHLNNENSCSTRCGRDNLSVSES